MKNTTSWPTRFQPSSILWGILDVLVLLLCLHFAWGCTLWTIYGHVNHSVPTDLQWPPIYNLSPIQQQVFMDASLVFWSAVLTCRFGWLVWLGKGILTGCALGSLIFFGVTGLL